MRAIITVAMMALSLPAQAVICKIVDPDGGVSYADVPAAECPHEVKLPEPSRYTPRSSTASGSPGPVADDAGVAGDLPASYTAIAIEQPAQGGTVRNNDGTVPVSVAMTPLLQPGHRLRLMLDGVQIQPSFDSQSVTLTGVKRGSHSLIAHVVNADGVILRSASPIRFTLRQALPDDTVTPPPASPAPN